MVWLKKRSTLVRTKLTSMSTKMASEGITASASIAAEGALEGFFTCVQLNVSQQVPLLGERYTALVALERPVT